MVRGRHRVALGAEQLARTSGHEAFRTRRRSRRSPPRRRSASVTDRDPLLLLVSLDRIDSSRELGCEIVLVAHELAPALVEAGGRLAVEVAELFAVAVLRQDCEPRLRRPERDLLALERDPLGEDRVLQLVLALGELLVGNPGLALLAQAIEALALVALVACSSAERSASSCSRLKRSAYAATIAARSEISFSPTRTARTSSARSKR